MNKEQQIVEFQNDIIDNLFNGGTYKLAESLYNAGYRKTLPNTELFTQNMKNVLEIEKKQAVKEFAEKLKKKVHNYYPSIDSYCTSRHVILVKDIDELLKEYEK